MMFGSIVSAVGGLAGGLLSAKSQASANAAAIAMQKDFAQNGIRWKVQDAKAAGLHPLAALGAQTMSPSASLGATDYSYLAGMGQDIGRAIQSKMTKQERAEQQAYDQQMRQLNLRRGELENRYLEAQISSVNRTALPPSMPSAGSTAGLAGQSDAIPEEVLLRDAFGKTSLAQNSDVVIGADENLPAFAQSNIRTFKRLAEHAVYPDATGAYWHPLTGEKMSKPLISPSMLKKLKLSPYQFAKFMQEIGSYMKGEATKKAYQDSGYWSWH